MNIKDGGATSNVRSVKITEIRAVHEAGRTVQLWIDDSLSYLTIEEALDLRDELNNAIRAATQNLN